MKAVFVTLIPQTFSVTFFFTVPFSAYNEQRQDSRYYFLSEAEILYVTQKEKRRWDSMRSCLSDTLIPDLARVVLDLPLAARKDSS